MAEEVVEIELTAPAGSGHELDRTIQLVNERDKKETREKKNLEIALVAAFDEAARKRNAFVFSEKHRTLRVERFEQAVKAIAKRMSAEAAKRVSDREVRLEVGVQVYRGLMLLLNELGRRQEASAATARRALKWSLGITTASLAGIGLTLFVTSILPV